VLRGSIAVSGRDLPWTLWRAASAFADFPLYLLEHEVFRDGTIYGGHGLERQALLGDAARSLALTSRSGSSPFPRIDVVHAHDHHAAFAALWLRSDVPVIATIHNARYHGDHSWDAVAGLLPPGTLRGDCDHAGRFNSLKAAILAARLVTTVSPTHARELASRPESSNGLDYAFRAIGARLIGILNGVDTDAWNPAADPALVAPFSASDLSGKARNKEAVCREHGLDPSRALLAFVGRLVPEKGVEVLLDVLAFMAQRAGAGRDEAQFLVLGTGEGHFEDWLRRLAREHPRHVAAAVRHDEALAHLVYAGADMLLMPSWHEPCGLSQMYALRYGTVPIVNPVGGLRDSITPFDGTTGRGNGFWMERCDGAALGQAIARAMAAWRQDATWRMIQANGMGTELSWAASAARYAESSRQVAEATS
jgi:starch synthase